MFSASEVVQALIQQKEEQISTLRKQIEEARNDIASAGRPKKDAPEDILWENSQKCHRISARIRQTETIISSLRNLPSGSFDCVSIGAIIHLRSREGREYYLIVPNGGGCQVEIDGQKVTCISVQAPVVQKLLGKKTGEVVLCNGCHLVEAIH